MARDNGFYVIHIAYRFATSVDTCEDPGQLGTEPQKGYQQSQLQFRVGDKSGKGIGFCGKSVP